MDNLKWNFPKMEDLMDVLEIPTIFLSLKVRLQEKREKKMGYKGCQLYIASDTIFRENDYPSSRIIDFHLI